MAATTKRTECVPRYATARSPERATLGRAAARVARALGQPLMPWQRHVLDVALELRPDGKPAFRDVLLTVPRQQGKSFLLLALMVTRALLSSQQNIAYCAQSALDAKKKWADDWLPLIQASPLAAVASAYHAPGREALRFVNGSQQVIIASTAKAGHGQTLDLAVIDEAFAYRDARLEQALRPAMMTRPDAQLWICSTAGTPELSTFLLAKVEGGRLAVEAGAREGLAYFEWSARDDADPADPATWRSCMPALGYSVDEEAVRAAQATMPRNEFARAFLNRWVAALGDPLVSIERWDELADPDAPRPAWIVLGLDVAPRGESAAIVAVGEGKDEAGADVLRSAVLEHGAGTDWVLGALSRLVAGERERPHVLLDEKACAALLPEVKAIVGPERVIALGVREVPAACAFWLRLVNEGRLRHRGESELAVALDGAAQRSLGDGWAWSRARSGVDITPLAALCWATEFWRGSWGTEELAP